MRASLRRRVRLSSAAASAVLQLCAASPVELLQQIDVHVCWVAHAVNVHNLRATALAQISRTWLTALLVSLSARPSPALISDCAPWRRSGVRAFRGTF